MLILAALSRGELTRSMLPAIPALSVSLSTITCITEIRTSVKQAFSDPGMVAINGDPKTWHANILSGVHEVPISEQLGIYPFGIYPPQKPVAAGCEEWSRFVRCTLPVRERETEDECEPVY